MEDANRYDDDRLGIERSMPETEAFRNQNADSARRGSHYNQGGREKHVCIEFYD